MATRAPGSLRMLALAWLVYLYFGLLAFSLAPLIGTLQSQLHFSAAAAGLLLGAYPLAYVVTALQVGRLADTFGVKRSVTVGVALVAVSALLRSPAHSFLELFAATLLLGIGGPVVSTVLPKLVAEWFPVASRTGAIGIYLTGPNLGAAVAFGFTPALASALGSWRTLYLVYGAAGVALLGTWQAFALERTGPFGTPAGAGKDNSAEAGTLSRPAWRIGRVWLVVATGAVTFVMTQGYVSWIPALLSAQGLSGSGTALWDGLSRLGTLAGNIALAPWLARPGRARLAASRDVITGLLAICAAGIAVGVIGSQLLTVTGLLVQSVCAGALMPMLFGVLLALPGLPSQQAATAAGLYFTVG
ncbi:MAG: MFS transporter, partial [Nocardiopsaceae bacterium]|nr:MFS transporter [Nocardiopsaceae bacterium]